MNTLEKIIPFLLNPYTGTGIFVIALGYIIRAVPSITNRFIPPIVIAVGSVFFAIIIPITAAPDPKRVWNWYVLMWGVGVGISTFAWMVHLVVISRLEEWLRGKIPALDEWFKKTSDDKPKS